MRTVANVDNNQPEIVRELRDAGLDVDHTHTLGKGMPDLIVSGVPLWADRSVAVRVEVKSESGELNKKEREYWQKQNHDNLIIARSADDVFRWFGRI